ncbi:nicotinate phosphoribosyltransferase [Pontibacter ummariensis]|uniref:Nicotinate phosphoribosyltransferase n=1 Tax=Pontibacter ummariensis TaxID=1610492 RepID=A0A239KIR7_9BACT|nr:nicotinate phosphoribosyltransferase [Pontibacter ummariensis]PRY05716.1 nicotinate phosphoribosyltransferase [Pontibacter ummariensis]SNT18071.1 nicotinate phosphoribosyltransferase [Pontibacter ummariensis]
MALKDIYATSLSLLTDLYQLTMAYGYWKSGKAEQEAVFHLYFRKNPFTGGYTIAAGLEHVVQYLQDLRFRDEDLAYLASLKGSQGQPLFEQGFLDYLRNMEFSCSVDAVPEGTVVFPSEPLIRVTGPLLQAQLIETPLLTILNFQTLIATKAARIVDAAKGDQVIEFGMRRAQGIDGALSAARAAYIGGVSATSDLLAGQHYNIPVRGTHAHSWVQAFDSEEEAFEAYGDAFPQDTVFLVDTYDTLEGVKKAISTAQKLGPKGFKLGGIRLDSGDLTYLSVEARKLLDAAGFTDTNIVASNDLDERLITHLKQEGAKINVWGIGTKMVTAYDQPALGGVYKLAALRTEQGDWEYKIKLSEQLVKTSNPGKLQVRRYMDDSGYMADMIYNQLESLPDHLRIVDPLDSTRRKSIAPDTKYKELLVPVFEQGKLTYTLPDLQSIQATAKEELSKLHESIRRYLNPHSYPAGLEESLHHYKTALILKLRNE